MQDLLEGGAGAAATARNPNALYEIDKLSMDHVMVFPDGQLNVRVERGQGSGNILSALRPVFMPSCLLASPALQLIADPLKAKYWL